MSIQITEPAKTLTGRARGVFINKMDPEKPQILVTYTKDDGSSDLQVTTTPTELIAEEVLAIGEVETLVALITKMCDAKSPYKVEE